MNDTKLFNEHGNKAPENYSSKNIPKHENVTTPEPKENTGMDMGTGFVEEKQQDLDDLIHKQNGLKGNEIPPPDES